jgi:hypothetical protein
MTECRRSLKWGRLLASLVVLVIGGFCLANTFDPLEVLDQNLAGTVFGEAKRCIKRSSNLHCSEITVGCPAICVNAVCDAPEDNCFACPEPPTGDVWRCEGPTQSCTTGSGGPQTSCGKKLKGTCTNTTCTPDDEPCEGNCAFEPTISQEDCPTIDTHGCVH